MHSFFGLNDTAGVWRVSAINAAEGWKDRTTVEDMDLAVRASLHGFLYVGDIRVKSELPSTFMAYHYQQHQWTCGTANLFRKMARDIVRSKAYLYERNFIFCTTSLYEGCHRSHPDHPILLCCDSIVGVGP